MFKEEGTELFRLGLLLAVLTFATPASASIIVGFLTFDHDAPVTGQNEVSVNNYTGQNFCSSDFQACDMLTFQNLAITVAVQGGPNQVFTAANQGPGSLAPPSFVFPGNLNILSITFSATISPVSFHLFDQSLFQAGPVISSAPLIPNSNELSLLSVDVARTSVPEPGTVALLLVGIAGASLLGHRRIR